MAAVVFPELGGRQSHSFPASQYRAKAGPADVARPQQLLRVHRRNPRPTSRDKPFGINPAFFGTKPSRAGLTFRRRLIPNLDRVIRGRLTPRLTFASWLQ